jgi:hypothetical protein
MTVSIASPAHSLAACALTAVNAGKLLWMSAISRINTGLVAKWRKGRIGRGCFLPHPSPDGEDKQAACATLMLLLS